MTTISRTTSRLAVLAACGLALSACGPTYGTGTPAGEQLLSDIDGMFLFGSSGREAIDYSERPELRRPDQIGQLPPPQTPRQEAAQTAMLPPAINRGPSAPLTDREADRSWLSPQDLRTQGQAAASQRAALRQGESDRRRYLSEPPVEYRQPAATAPVGDLGLDEDVKERRASGTRPLGARIREALPF